MLAVPQLTKSAGGQFNFTGGVLSAGEVTFDLLNQGGVIAPGASPGATHIAGNLTVRWNSGGCCQLVFAHGDVFGE